MYQSLNEGLSQTQAVVSKHVTVSVLLIHNIQNTFLQQCMCPFSHMETRILNQLREELLSKAECYLHQALSGTSAMSYFRVPVPLPTLLLKREATFPLMMRKGTYHWEAK